MAVHYTFIPSMRWLSEGRIQVDHLVSKVITLEQGVDFFEQEKNRDHLKIQIQL
jgi:threonine dehydrogenase-like Zn-dependent dehydrogenase